MQSIFFLLIFFFLSLNYVSGFFRSRSKIQTENCCILPKTYVNAKRANLGKNFFRQLIIKSDIYDQINQENLCNLMHFLFQQASINNKPITFTEGMFIIFDSSNQIIDRLTSSIKQQPIPNNFDIPNRLSFINSTVHIGRKVINTASKMSNIFRMSNTNSEDRYPTYGIDIHDSCLLSHYDHIIFGELPPFLNDDKYNGRRIFVKPDRFGFEKVDVSSVLNDVQSFITRLVKQQFFCQFIKGETKSECAKLQAFKQNIDQDLLNKWKRILLELPSKWTINKQLYKERAIKYGIREIDQQVKYFETLGAGKYVKRFKKLLIERYGQDDIRVRKGREILFTSEQLKQSYSTCETPNDIKCKF